ncbi:multiple monosaccharide ABC transporter substrate-binding protein [Actinoplanes derwentensis]|uniref:Monosaccharide ABC transporter substrate-binding protein, CUT2 family n=1 Tax=Actinoplanes derwentensis TaxID=113562 RepID=A0A1H1THE7_9ACTN|nr:multiple monosaccharide ABC transporter substrate-binding protein [Actinoplanes derwentensis]GID85032.1 sugar ABC transporter substrate-binding protein [Actinoplanes derwentensis]SDS59638.1 monosaccharide ABC transporter substrate-binding protein, CUT2 family [Actinoplanes derwentensis]
MRLRNLRALAAASAAVLVLSSAACGSSEKTTDKTESGGAQLIGVTMPTRSSQRWIGDGENVKKALETLGYQVDLQYAEDDIPTQVNQVESQITRGAKLLIIAPVDGTAMTTQLQTAADRKIPVIAYDWLLRNSPNVDYYATFDNYKVGVQQATSLLIGLKLLDADGSPGAAKGPFNVELFAGSPDDNNATFFFDGAMSVLKPYLDKGTLVVPSRQTDFKTIAILRWQAEVAQKRMENLLTSTYRSGLKVQGVLSPYDGISIGIVSALRTSGYGINGQPYPVITGQDAETTSIKSIIDGEQYSTVFKDFRELAKTSAQMADAILKGQKPTVNNDKDYDNGVKVVPAMLLDTSIVNKANYEQALITSGFYRKDQLR